MHVVRLCVLFIHLSPLVASIDEPFLEEGVNVCD